MDDDLGKAKAIFDLHKIHHILVLNDKELVGVITDRDIYKHLSPTIGTKKETARDHSSLSKKLHLVMNRNLTTTSEDASLNEAVLLFHDNHISCLPVVNDKMEPLGIISWRDILKVIALQYRHKLSDKK
jgi:acetoin utilization protein AcuB